MLEKTSDAENLDKQIAATVEQITVAADFAWRQKYNAQKISRALTPDGVPPSFEIYCFGQFRSFHEIANEILAGLSEQFLQEHREKFRAETIAKIIKQAPQADHENHSTTTSD